MISDSQNKENILCQSYQGEGKKFEKEELINSQLDKSKKNKNNDEEKPIHNYPYEFYDDDKQQKELNQNELHNNEEKTMDNNEIIKAEKQNLEKIPEQIEVNLELENKEIIKNEAVQNELKNKNLKKEEEKKVIKDTEKGVIKEPESKDNKEPIKEVNYEIIKEPENREIKGQIKEFINEDIKMPEKKEIIEKEKKEIKEVEKKENKEKEIKEKKKKEIIEEKKINKEPEKKVIKEEKKISKEAEKKINKEEKMKVLKEKEIKDKKEKEKEKKLIKESENQPIKQEKKVIKGEIKQIKQEKKVIKEEKKPVKEENKVVKKEEKKPIKQENKVVKKEEIKPIKQEKKVVKKEDKKPVKEENKVVKKEENKIVKKEEKKNIKEEAKKVEKKEISEKFRNSQKKDDKIRNIILKNMDKKDLEAPLPPREEYIPPKVKTLKMKTENKENKSISEKKPSNQIQKTKLTKQTEDNYNLMIQQLKNKDYKNAEDHVIKNIINSDNKIFNGENNNKVDNSKRKELIEDFLQRNQDEIINRQNNRQTINDRMKIADESSKKRIYFNNVEDEQEYFDEFYNKQIQYKNGYQINLDRLTQQLNEEKQKNYIPEPKNKTNLDYFKNNNPVVLSKYKKENKIKIENKKENENEKTSTTQLRSKKPNNILSNKEGNSGKESSHKIKEAKNENTSSKNKQKKSQKEIDELTNKLHYEGELLKVKKQTKISEVFANNPNYHNFSKEKLSRSSLIILIKKFLYEYSTSIKNNSFIDCIKNPKLNYDQYIDILKDLYYLEKDALPEEYLEDDTMYKELWDKLTKFSKGPENSLESNILLLYLLELNGFFRNEKLIKELETEIHWIKLEDYEELIANAKFIEENWDDLKSRKNENIKKLKTLKKYNPIHNEEIYNNNAINNSTNPNINSININDSNHYITIIKGNTNYELIHGYSTKKKAVENDSFSELLNDKKGPFTYNSLTMSNNMNKTNKNRITLQDGYNEIILKKKADIENIKLREEKKLKETCPFKPTLTTMSKKMFKNNTKADLPKHRLNKSVNLYGGNTQNNNHNNSKSPLNKNLYGKDDKSANTMKLRKNKSNLQKMFENNPLKEDKYCNERIQLLKSVKSNEINDDNYMIIPMRFNIDYPSKFEGIGISINRDSNLRQFPPNIIFYNIKVNDKIRTLKYIEGDDLKLNVINFVKKNKLPEEVVNIIFKKIKEKELEEKMNNQC